MNSPAKKVFLALISLFLIIQAASAKEVEGLGLAAGKGESSKQEALMRAMRNAVEKAVGVMVSSETIVKNFQLLEDNVYSQVNGYVQSYEIIEDNKGVDDLYRIKIRAVVEEAKLENDLKGIKVILAARGNPRIAVMIDEKIDGQEMKSLSADVEAFLKAKSFPIVDAKTISGESIEEGKTKDFGEKYGVDLIVVGEASAVKGDRREAYGVPVYSSSANINIKAVHADTGIVLAIMSQSQTAHAGNASEAGTKAFKEAWEKGKIDFFQGIMTKLKDEALNEITIEILIKNLDPQMRSAVLEKLKSLEGIRKFIERKYDEKMLLASVKVDAAKASNIDELIIKSVPDMVLETKTSNHLSFVLSPANEKMTEEAAEKKENATETNSDNKEIGG